MLLLYTTMRRKLNIATCICEASRGLRIYGIFNLTDYDAREVFAFAALDYVRFDMKGRQIMASDISERVHEWLPPMCQVNDEFFLESLPMFLRHSKSTCSR